MPWTSADDNAQAHFDSLPRTLYTATDREGRYVVSGWFRTEGEARAFWADLPRFADRIHSVD